MRLCGTASKAILVLTPLCSMAILWWMWNTSVTFRRFPGHLSTPHQAHMWNSSKAGVIRSGTSGTSSLSEEDRRCPRLWSRDLNTLSTGKDKPLVPRKQRDYRQATRDCGRYRKEFGFRDMTSVSPRELSFPLAFSVLVYKDVEQVERLLRALYRPHNVYCIHVDAKAHDSFRKKVALFSRCLPNVFLSSVSVKVRWGTFSTLAAELQCLRQLWAQRVTWRYYINLTGQEFPLKTNRELVQILAAFKGANDITGDSTLHTARWKDLPPPPFHLRIYRGSVHVAASRAFTDYALHSNVSRQLLAWLRRERVVIPDELFYNTLNHNAFLGVPGSVKVPQNYRDHQDSFNRYKVWLGKASSRSATTTSSSSSSSSCSGRFIRRICHFGVGDLPWLVRSPKLFANKFSYNFQPLAYDCLELWLLRKMQEEEEEEEEENEMEEEEDEEVGEEKKKKKQEGEASSRSSWVEVRHQAKAKSSGKRRTGVLKKLDLKMYERARFVKNRYTGPVKLW